MTYKMSSYGPFATGVAIRGMPILNTHAGSVFWVDSNGGGGKGSFARPCATLNAAYDLCTADKGDIVMVKSGHSETITATVLLDTAGVSIVGIGNGSKRPKLLWDAGAAADNMYEITAAGQVIENIWFYDSNTTASSIAQVFIDIQAGGDDFTMINCRMEQRAATEEAITICNSANDLSFIGCEFLGTSAPTSSGADTAITVEGSTARLRVIDCLFDYQLSVGCDLGNIVFEVSGSQPVLIKDCITLGLADSEEFVQTIVGCSNDEMLMVHCYGQVTDITDVLVVSKSFTVIDSYFAEVGTYAGGALPAGTDDLNRWVPTATSNS